MYDKIKFRSDKRKKLNKTNQCERYKQATFSPKARILIIKLLSWVDYIRDFYRGLDYIKATILP